MAYACSVPVTTRAPTHIVDTEIGAFALCGFQCAVSPGRRFGTPPCQRCWLALRERAAAGDGEAAKFVHFLGGDMALGPGRMPRVADMPKPTPEEAKAMARHARNLAAFVYSCIGAAAYFRDEHRRNRTSVERVAALDNVAHESVVLADKLAEKCGLMDDAADDPTK